jgi:hypothetical protein
VIRRLAAAVLVLAVLATLAAVWMWLSAPAVLAAPGHARVVAVREIFCKRGTHRVWDARHHRFVCVRDRH